MARESTQKKLERVRPPRVHISYDVETGGAIEMKELPFVMGVLGDFTGQPAKPLAKLKERKFVEVTPDNFDDVLASMKPHLHVHGREQAQRRCECRQARRRSELPRAWTTSRRNASRSRSSRCKELLDLRTQARRSARQPAGQRQARGDPAGDARRRGQDEAASRTEMGGQGGASMADATDASGQSRRSNATTEVVAARPDRRGGRVVDATPRRRNAARTWSRTSCPRCWRAP